MKEAIRIAAIADHASTLVMISVIDAAAPLHIDDMSLKTSRRLFDHVQLASMFIENRPFLSYVCTVLPLSQAEIDLGTAELRVLHADGRTDRFDVRIHGLEGGAGSPTAFSEHALRQCVTHLRAMGLPLARSLAFGHAIAASAPAPGASGAGARLGIAGGPQDDPVAAAIAPHFDQDHYRSSYPDLVASGIATTDADRLRHYCRTGWKEGRNPSPAFDTLYYLATNTDVAEAGVNPFWHHIVVGRAEGRRGRPPDGHRRAILRSLASGAQRSATPAFDRVVRLRRERVGEAMMARAPFAADVRGVVVSVSHDCYVRSIGGTQILISDEQRRFNALGYRYIHVSPYRPRWSIDLEGPGAELVELVVDGVHVGTTDYADVAWAVGDAFGGRTHDRHFVVHCALGHRVDGLIALQRAARPSRNWFWVHDFSSVCANHMLLRNDVSFCGAPPPDSAACGVCVHGEERARHTRAVERLFAAIGFHVVAPSQPALDLWRHGARLPALSTSVVEHCRVVERGVRSAVGDRSTLGLPGNPVHVAVVGAPSFHKGWGLFEELVRALPESFSYRFHHFAAPEAFRHPPGVTEVPVAVTATTRDTMVDALAAHRIDLVLVPSVLPETFSFVTHEALAAGADVLALEVGGNAAATVARLGRGRVFASEADLLAFFTGFAAVDYVIDRLREGIPAGTLDHCGTTAALVEPVEATA